jgi:hypothetical protein
LLALWYGFGLEEIMMNKTPAWVGWTYVAYLAVSYGGLWGIPGYAVFWLGYSPWFLVIGLLSGFAYSPWRWFAIWDGIERPYSKQGLDRSQKLS